MICGWTRTTSWSARASGRARVVGRAVLRREEREAELGALLAPGATRPVGRRHPGARRGARSVPPVLRARPRPRSSTRARGGGSRASARCSSPPKTITSAPGSPTPSRSRRSPPASPGSPNLCLPLVEAIALAHDCGHGPAGHASEDAFAPYLPGGYDHAVYGADVTLEPLNLCVQTLDGVRNHSWRRPAPSTAEGEVVAWADRIAYVCHDFEDACRAGILEPRRSARRGRRRRRHPAFRADRGIRPRGARRDRPHRSGRDDRARGRRAHGLPSVQLRAHLPAARVGPPGRAGDRSAPRASSTPTSTSPIAGLPRGATGAHADLEPGSPEAAAVAVRYVSGMTDRFALAQGVELLGCGSRRCLGACEHLAASP